MTFSASWSRTDWLGSDSFEEALPRDRRQQANFQCCIAAGRRGALPSSSSGGKYTALMVLSGAARTVVQLI